LESWTLGPRHGVCFKLRRVFAILTPDKISIKTFASGVDFLGWVHFPDHSVLRTTTKKRMFNRLNNCEGKPEVVSSYLGLITHGNSTKLKNQIEKEYGVKDVLYAPRL
jgi:hypothetical protein